MLSKREKECLSHLAYGKTAKMIANDMGLSQRTIEMYIRMLCLKLQVAGKYNLTRRAIELGFLELSETSS